MAETRKRTRRTTPRVTKTEGSSGTVDTEAGNVYPGTGQLPAGLIEITVQASEKVPIAQYANVTIGPVASRRIIADPGLSKLAGTDPEDWDDDQQAIAKEYQDQLRVSSFLIQEVLAEDREAVLESVLLANAKEAEKAKEESKGKGK